MKTITTKTIWGIIRFERQKLCKQAKLPQDYYFLWSNNKYKFFKQFLKEYSLNPNLPLFLGMYHKVGVDMNGYKVLSVADNPEVKEEIRMARYKYHEQKEN